MNKPTVQAFPNQLPTFFALIALAHFVSGSNPLDQINLADLTEEEEKSN